MTEKRSLYEMQEEVDAYIQQFKAGYFSPLAQMARLTEEVGELAREVNHHYGEKAKKKTEVEKTVAEELMANSMGIDLTEVFESNMKKFNRRDAYRFERKDGKMNEAD